MPTVLIIASALILFALACLTGTVMFIQFLTEEALEDERMRFDPLVRPLRTSPGFFAFFWWWRDRPKQITSRRDARGRFRKRGR